MNTKPAAMAQGIVSAMTTDRTILLSFGRGGFYFGLEWYRGKSKWHNPVIHTTFQPLIRSAWGPRRLSSKAEPGTLAYPEEIGATRRVWRDWIRTANRRRRRGIDMVVVTAEGADHGAEYLARLAAEAAEALAQERRRALALTPEQVEDLQEQRRAARAAKDFALADSIRDRIIAAGYAVADTKLPAVSRV